MPVQAIKSRARRWAAVRWYRRAADAFVSAFRVDNPGAGAPEPNPLESYFDAHHTGPGIWKWRHYFPVYDRHLAKFRGTPVRILEVGIYSGGSLPMWRDYFGPQAVIYGADIEPACKAYERDGTHVLIGDQSDREFWRKVRNEHPPFDVVIDDGGHTPHQQRVTLEEALPHLNPGGVFICEDVHGTNNSFSAYAARLAQYLHNNNGATLNEDMERRATVPASAWQSAIGSVHTYPFMVVVERRTHPVPELVGPKHGTEWQPFLDDTRRPA